MNAPERETPHSREVNPIRLKTFLEILGQEIGYAEMSRTIDRLPSPYREIARSLEKPEWLSADTERFILNAFLEKFKATDRLRATGRECVQFLLMHFITAFPGTHSIRGMLSHFPSLTSLFLSYLQVHLQEDDDRNGFTMRIEYRPGYEPSSMDIVFVSGLVEGFLRFLKVEHFQLATAQEDTTRGRILVRTQVEDGGVALLERQVNTQETFVWQVIHRSAELLKDKKELATAVDYLNMANNELEREIRSNKAELNMAKNIQKGFIPQEIPDWHGIQFCVKFHPMKEVSGDLYDYFMLSGNRFVLLAGDVSGHGVPAALISAIVKLSFTNHKQDIPSDVFSNVNLDLINYVKMEGYLTAFYAVINPDHSIVYSIAGLPPPLLYRKATGTVERLQGTGVLLGMFPDAGDLYMNQRTALEPGDILCIFSDGLTEATDPHSDFLGEDRVRDALLEAGRRGFSADEAAAHVEQLYHDFILGQAPMDDLTIVMLRVSERRDEFESLIQRAKGLKKERKTKEACNLLEEAIRIFPRHPDALYLFGKYLAASGRYDESTQVLHHYNSLRPSDPNAATILAYCHIRQGNLDRGEKELKRSLSIRSMNPSALFHLVRLYQQLGRKDEAETFLSALKFLQPDDPRVQSLHMD